MSLFSHLCMNFTEGTFQILNGRQDLWAAIPAPQGVEQSLFARMSKELLHVDEWLPTCEELPVTE